MTIYSYNGAAPAPLPTTRGGTPKIRIPDGQGFRARTGEFTLEELTAAGYVAVEPQPTPNARQLDAAWVDGAWVLPEKSVELRKYEMKLAITARRWAVETGGISVFGASIATDALTQAKLSGALQLVQDTPSVVIDWKSADNDWVSLDAATVTTIARTVGLHVQACFSREKSLHAEVDAAEDHDDLDLIDVNSGSVDGTGSWTASE